MATSSSTAQRRKRPRTGPRYQMEVNFPDEETKKAFLGRLERAKAKLSSLSSRTVDNFAILSSMLDQYENMVDSSGQDTAAPTTVSRQQKTSRSILNNSGVYTRSNEYEDGEKLFICERETFRKLTVALGQCCECKSMKWSISSMIQFGHTLRVEFQCHNCHRKLWWCSSRVFGGKYIVNQKLVHGFTCAGIIPSQYINCSTFADIGCVSKRYIRFMYTSLRYMEVVSRCTESSFVNAIKEVQSLPDYATNGEWVITDARHDSTANAYHTTVPCLSGSTHKIVGCSTLSRRDHLTAQTRELACTKVVLPEVIGKGLNVVEVAHDNCPSVKNYIMKDLKLINSFDTWHGTKNVARHMKAIAIGPIKNAGKSWFPELSDKRRSTKIHLYYCMKNCNRDPQKLRANILNIVEHYQGEHCRCNIESNCRRPGYASSKVKLQDTNAIQVYTKKLKETLIYANAESYCHCRDTFWVESFNHHLLTYAPKRIHFGTDTFVMRMNMACMDWNENVGRSATSERLIQDMRRPDRRTPCKVLVKKTFQFVDMVWKAYVELNSENCSATPIPSTSEEGGQEIQMDDTPTDLDEDLEDGLDLSEDIDYHEED